MSEEPGAVPCGCMGKTALKSVVYPARQRVRHRLAAAGVYLSGTLDCGLLPRRESLEREPTRIVIEGGAVRQSATSTTPKRRRDAWGLTAVLADAGVGTGVATFSDALESGYRTLSGGGRVTIAKGHSVQIAGSDRTTLLAELLFPGGERRPGYVAGNVDVVHAFPGLDQPTQAAIAGAHALNDCYAYGGIESRVLRPVVCVPEAAEEPTPGDVEAWYRDGVPDGVEIRRPTILAHGGDGRLFGATVTTELTHTPPIHAGRLEAGDVVLLHRPLGAVAALSMARADGDRAAFERFTETLATDHADVAELVAALSPERGADFDPDRHLKLASDVSGPGIGGIAETVGRGDHELRVERLPFVDETAVRRARDRWLVPDATVGTNGPIAMIGRSTVVDRAAARLEAAGFEPVRLGCVDRSETDGRDAAGRSHPNSRSGVISTVDGISLSEFVEDATLFTDGFDSPDGTPQR